MLPFAMGIYDVHGHRWIYSYSMLVRASCVLSHAYFMVEGNGFYERAFINICEHYVICWFRTTCMGSAQSISMPVKNNIYHNGMAMSIDMGG